MATRKQLEQQYIEDRAFWGSVSSRWRGLAGGVLIGMALGATIGLVAASLFAAATSATLGGAALLATVGTFTLSGGMIGMGLWGNAGQVSGAVAAGLMAQKELAAGKSHALEQEVAISQKPLAAPNTKPLVNWKVALLGMAFAAVIGAGLALGGVGLPEFVLLGATAKSGAAAGAAAITFGLFGTVFGINFRPWQAFKRWTDGFFEGRINGRTVPAIPEIKAQLAVQPPAIEQTMHTHFADNLLQERGQASTISFSRN